MKVEARVLTVAVLATSMAFIDVTALNVALPALQDALGATAAELLWIINAYAVPLTGLLLWAGALGDQRGRRRVLGLGIGLFGLASLACGLAPSGGTLIAARVLQGVGAALMIPGSLALIGAMFPAHRLGRAVGLWSAFTVVAMAAGPVLGGALAERGLWRVVFLLNLPLVLVALLLLPGVPESRDPAAPHKLDLPGALLALLALGSLSYTCIEAPERGIRDGIVVAAFVLGLVALLCFVLVEARRRYPLLPFQLLRTRAFWTASLLTLLLYTAFHGMMVFLPLNLVQVQGYGALQAGLAQAPVLLLIILLAPVAGRIFDRHGPRLLLGVGAALAGLGFLLLGFSGMTRGPGDYMTRFLPAFTGLGAGLGLCVAPLSTMVLTALGSGRFALASGINSTLSRLAGVLAVALCGALGQSTFHRTLHEETRLLSVGTQAALQGHARRLAATQVPPGVPETERAQVEQAIPHSFLAAFESVSLLGAGLSGTGLLVALFVAPRRRPHDRTPR